MSAVSVHGLTIPCSGPGAAWVRYLIATFETPNSAPAAAPRRSPSTRRRRWRCAEIQEYGADGDDRALDGDHRRRATAAPRCGPTAGESDHRQSDRGDRHADPLPPSEAKAEVALADHGQEHDSAGHDRLHDRQRRECQRADVQPQATIATIQPITNHLERNRPAALRERMAHSDRRREHGSPLLEQERDVGGQRRSGAREAVRGSSRPGRAVARWAAQPRPSSATEPSRFDCPFWTTPRGCAWPAVYLGRWRWAAASRTS